MDEKGVQNSSVSTVKELQASLNSEGKAKSDVHRRRNIRATHRASNSLKAGKCYLRGDCVKQRPKIQKKSNGTAVIAPNKAPRFQSSCNHIPCNIFTNNGNNGEPMTTDTGVLLMLKYDYQETQTVWKTTMDTQDQLWSKNRSLLHQSIVESLPVCKEAVCSNCRRLGSTPVKCQTCRTHLCAACDKVVQSKTVTHQRVCEVKYSLHQMLPTEFLNNVDSLETINVPVPILEPVACGFCK